MKDKIICLVGPSGSGKTTIAKELEKENKRQSKLIDELLNENKAYKRVVTEWGMQDEKFQHGQ